MLVQQIENEKRNLPTFLAKRIQDTFLIEPQDLNFEASRTALSDLRVFELVRNQLFQKCWGIEPESLRDLSMEEQAVIKCMEQRNMMLENEYALNVQALRKWVGNHLLLIYA